jgi:hypothetical protein
MWSAQGWPIPFLCRAFLCSKHEKTRGKPLVVDVHAVPWISAELGVSPTTTLRLKPNLWEGSTVVLKPNYRTHFSKKFEFNANAALLQPPKAFCFITPIKHTPALRGNIPCKNLCVNQL